MYFLLCLYLWPCVITVHRIPTQSADDEQTSICLPTTDHRTHTSFDKFQALRLVAYHLIIDPWNQIHTTSKSYILSPKSLSPPGPFFTATLETTITEISLHPIHLLRIILCLHRLITAQLILKLKIQLTLTDMCRVQATKMTSLVCFSLRKAGAL